MRRPELFKTSDLETERGWKWLMDDSGHVWFYIDDTYWFLFPNGGGAYGLCLYDDESTGNFPRRVFESADAFLHAKIFANGTCVLDRLGDFMSYEPDGCA